jgi:PDZ domain-containing protein
VRLHLAKNRWIVYIAAALVAAVALAWHTPYSLLLPGQSLDLRRVISVHGRPTPSSRFDMTDVTLEPDVPPIHLLQAFLPGGRLLPTSQLVPTGVSVDQYDQLMRDAMHESQLAAVYVAERAAGYTTGPLHERVMIGRVAQHTPAQGVLRAGDEVLALDDRPVTSTAGLQAATAAHRSGDAVELTVLRNGRTQRLTLHTINLDGRTRLGIYLFPDVRFPLPAVPVTFRTGDISGSSGGLMFALEIYRALRPQNGSAHIAGTGTIDANGNVGPIEGTMQKLEAARRAGASIFLVPQFNYADVRGARDIKVIPVKTFADAVKASDT